MMKRKARGQSLVEFALVIPLFLALMMGILDGTRLLFTFNEIQEAAHAGARWGAVNIGRVPWVDPSNPIDNGNTSVTESLASTPLTVTGSVTPTIAGQVASKLTAVDFSQTTISIEGTTNITHEVGTQDGDFRMWPVTVTVSYTFTPIISFGHVHIPLSGKSVYYHE